MLDFPIFVIVRVTVFTLVMNLVLYCSAQPINFIAEKSIQEAIPSIEKLVGGHIEDQVKIIGIGEVATFARETQRFNVALASYLISKRNFTTVLLEDDPWRVRILNEYLTSSQSLDTLLVDSLVRFSLSEPSLRTADFKMFVTWLKKHNLMYPKGMTSIHGVAPISPVPVDYMVNTYITPIDHEAASRLAEKWFQSPHSEAQAYQDIQDWVDKVDTTAISSTNKKLIRQYSDDTLHNASILKAPKDDGKFSFDEFNRFDSFILDRILGKANKNAILYSSNYRIMRGGFHTKRIESESSLPTLGKRLHHALAERYWTSSTDFFDYAELPVADMETRTGSLEKFTASESARNLAGKGYSFFLPKDIALIRDYLPPMISFYKGQERTVTLEEGIPPFNVVFLLSKLTHSNFLSNLD